MQLRTRSVRYGALTLMLVLAAWGCGCEQATESRGPGGRSQGAAPSGIDFADEAEIGALRVTVETGVANGAGTQNHIVFHVDNHGHRLSDDPITEFAAGHSVTRVISGSGVPRTARALRDASMMLTMDLERAAIAASWQCARAKVEVRLVGQEQYQPWLERDDVGWLSLDVPPRQSLAFALQ